MKKLFNLFILIILTTSMYSMRGDIYDLYNSLKNVVKDNTSFMQDFYFLKDFGNYTFFDNQIQNKETPGALKVIDSVFTEGNEKADLNRLGVFEFTNIERVKNKLSPLTLNEKLNISAQKKVDDMFKNQYFEHVSPNGIGVGDLGDDAGYEYIIIGENLALGNFKNNENVIEAWMNSPGHKANILNINYKEIGIGIGYGKFEENDVWLVVQHFGLPKSSCPQINDNLRLDIESTQKRVDRMQDNLSILDKDLKIEKTLEKIKEYNNLVNEYNKLLSKIKNNIEIYNLEVKEFNNCISGFNIK